MKRMRIHIAIPAFCLLLLLALPLEGMAKLPPEGRQAMFKAQQLLDDKKYLEAASLIRKYIKTTKETVGAQVYTMLGGALHEAGKRKQALDVFRKGHKAFPKDENLCLNTGITLYETEQYAEAGKYLEKAHALQKVGKDRLLYQAGTAYYLGERFRDSARVMLKLIAGAKKPKKSWIRLTIHALIDSKQPKRAESMLLQYLNLNPQEADYWQLLAKLHLEREEYSKAAAALEITYRLKKPTAKELEKLATLYRYRNAPIMAANTLRRAYGATPGPDQAIRIAALYASAGRIQQAVRFLNKFSNNSSALLEQGKVLYHSRRFKEAEAVFKKLAATKKSREAHFFLGLCAWERKDWKEAHRQLNNVAGLKKYRNRTAGYLAVLEDLESARTESMQ